MCNLILIHSPTLFICHRYFAHVHPIFPVVNKSEFLRQYRQQIDKLPSPPLLCAMYGSATRFIECCKAIRNQDLTASRLHAPSSDIWFSQHMSYVKCSFDPSLPIIQSILITMHHYAGSEKKWSDAWLLNSVVNIFPFFFDDHDHDICIALLILTHFFFFFSFIYLFFTIGNTNGTDKISFLKL